jgi:hypothetical protein
MKKTSLFIFTILSISIISCTPESDAPVIDSLTIPASIKIVSGASLDINYEFSDDSGLNQYDVSVLDDFDDARLQSAIWDYSSNFALSGTSASDVKVIPLPVNDIELGRYELTVTLQDIDGNETSVVRSFILN